MIDPAGYVLETLREDREFTVYRGRQRDNSSPVLAVALAAERPSPQSLRRLEHEYSLAAELDPKWATRPLALTRHDGRTMLVLEDPGGEPLDRVLARNRGQPLELTRFLRLAPGLASALGQVHRHGMIHKDIKPANVFVDDDGNVRLTGFGIASRQPHEYQAPAAPEVTAGTLAYMAPEQTGRMNRSIDSRSDLYSLGITLYEMLTGMLPFSAADPMEWIHCHIARRPAPPSERAIGVPAQLSAIVMKLLAKAAEERYQTAAGLEADLHHCLTEWEARRRIDPFPLGVHDVPDRLFIPEKLYGREREIGALLASFDRVVASGAPELVLVSGYSGVGKSSVVKELHKVLVASRGLFASGKFDQYERDIPYAPLVQALHTLIRQIVAKSNVEMAEWREALREAVGPNGQLIINLIPEVEFVIGKQPPVPDLPPRDAHNLFLMVFRRFLGVFARKEHPLALFIDDLQWIDTATLDLLEQLVTHSEVRHLLLILAYRDNEVSPAHPFLRTLETIRKAGASVEEIVLAPLGLDDVGRFASDALHCELERAQPLAQLVHEKTGGNPFFASQFFTALAEEGLLVFEPATRAWRWDISRIRAKSYTDNVAELMAGKLKRLSAPAQEALKQLACLGNVAEIATLTLVRVEAAELTHAALWEAVHAGLVFRLEGTYKFLHDRIQQAAYSLIPEEQRAGVHLRIGRVLLASMAADQLAEHLFDVASQLNRGAERLIERDEKVQVATIDLRAGRKAKASAAYASARAYFAGGMALLDEQAWSDQHELTFRLWTERAECELLSGDFEKAEQLIGELLQRGASNVEFADVSCLKMQLHVLKGEFSKAVDSALTCLRRFGIELPAHPTWEQVQAEHETFWQALSGRPIESLIDLPLMSDPELQAAMRVCAALIPPAAFSDFHSFCVLACRMVKLSVKHGMGGASANGCSVLGVILGPVFHRYGEGYRFAKLACDLVEKHGLIASRATVYNSMGSVAFWTQPIASAIDFTRATSRAAIEIGDLAYPCYGLFQSVNGLLLRNDPLEEVWRESELAIDVAREAKFGDAEGVFRCQQRFIATMQGRTTTFSTFSDAQFDEVTFEAQLTPDRMPLLICWYWILKLKARFLSGDYAEAIAAADNAKPLLAGAAGLPIQLLDYVFYAALTVAVLYENALADEQTRWRELLTAHREQLREWAETYPPTFADKYALVSAEIARVEGRDVDAMRLYEQAIRSARDHGFVQNEALAHETAARFFLARGLETIGLTYLRHARSCYDRWGALGKVKQLDARYPHLHAERTDASPTATISTRVEQLDVETVVKASQALSSEIVLPRLIEKLMRIAVEHAGAERGLLVLLQGDEPQIEAEATIGQGRIEVVVRQNAVTPTDLPQSILQYVIRTRARVILEDASVGSVASEDEYVRQKYIRSVLCLPIVKQTKLVGALYLENNLTPRAFTADRVAVLELLGSQAAISLENARLYSDLQRSEAFLAEGQSISSTGSFGWNVASGEVYWSDQTYKIFEHDRAVKPTLELTLHRIHPADRDFVQHALDRASTERTDFAFEHRLLMPDGRGKHLYVIGRALQSSSGNLEFVGAVTDVTDRKEAEEAVLQSEKRFRSMIEHSSDGIILDGLAKGYTYVSPSTERLLGYTPEEMVRPWKIDDVHPDHVQRREAAWSEVIREPKKVVTYEARARHKDGSWRWIETTLSNLLHEPSVQAVVVNFRDITVRKNAEVEKERLEALLRQSQKMEVMGMLAGGIAHDFNNILGLILGYGRLAQKGAPEDSVIRRHLDKVIQAGGHAKSLVARILLFSRSDVGERGPVNVQAVIEEALDLLAPSLAPGVRLAKRLETGDASIVGDATQLHQVAINLCTNALHAMENGGVLEVVLDRAELPQDRRLSHGNLAPGIYVRLCVSDTGSGIPPHVLDRMFDPFFTTKGAGEGTGLGLSLVHSIVTDLGGAIDVRTTVGRGTTFTIWLPNAGEAPAPSAEVTTELPHGDGQTVMIVDDEKALAALAEEILADLGYEPIGFTSSVAALAAFREAPQRFDIVLADQTMPELIGTNLAHEISLLRPDIPIILMSGYSDAPLAERARVVGVREVLRKPLQTKEVAECFGRVLR